jgi:hypothetical protein
MDPLSTLILAIIALLTLDFAAIRLGYDSRDLGV